MSDARFEDGGEQPLRLIATDVDDLQVISSLLQDAVCPASELSWDRHKRRFVVLLNRFRWEDRAAAEIAKRPVERVQSVLAINDVTRVASQGVSPGDSDLILSVLRIDFEPGDDGQGAVVLTLAGDGAIRCVVECLDLQLRDVTRPYVAPSGRAPSHPD